MGDSELIDRVEEAMDEWAIVERRFCCTVCSIRKRELAEVLMGLCAHLEPLAAATIARGLWTAEDLRAAFGRATRLAEREV